MSAPSFTPGPWRLGENDSEVVESSGALVAAVYATANSNRAANARLIAAAPEMVDALASFVDDYDDDRRDLQLEADHIARFRILIARVCGDQRGEQR